MVVAQLQRITAYQLIVKYLTVTRSFARPPQSIQVDVLEILDGRLEIV